jgi:HipA-like protein
MRKAAIYRNGIFAGILTEDKPGRDYTFRYDDNYFVDQQQPAVSLTLPKTKQEYKSPYLFPVFFNMLSEGVNKKLQSIQLRIDERDSFGLLLATAQTDTLGALTVKPMEKNEIS